MAHSTAKAGYLKPGKPHPDFPLFAHRNGQWAKKIRGKLHYFGKWAEDRNGQSALSTWLDEKDDLLAGRVPRVRRDDLTVVELVNHYLNAQESKLLSGDITRRTFNDCRNTCERIIGEFGRDRYVEDLQLLDFMQLRSRAARTCGAVALGNVVNRTRSVFRYAFEAALIKSPVQWGPDFKKPSKKRERLHKSQAAKKYFPADEILQLVEAAEPQLRAMILLAVNAGLGNNDCGRLPFSAIDFESGWLNYARSKTGIERRCPLWTETIDALQEAITSRPDPKLPEHSELVFLTRCGLPWAKDVADNPITKQFRKLQDRLELHQRGRGFYSLRHVFRTEAAGCLDEKAVDHIMGHDNGSISNRYTERIADERLVAVTEHVRAWLFGGVQ